MVKALLVGVVLGVLIVAGGVYFYFSSGRAPVATAGAGIPFERKMATMALHAYLNKLPHPAPQVPADEKNMMEGTKIYKENCGMCHGLPGQAPTAIAQGMAPQPPQLFKGTGVTDDEEWESYWKAEGGIRMSGMPGFKGRLTETQIWQVVVLVKNADKISPTVRAELAGTAPAPTAAPSPTK